MDPGPVRTSLAKGLGPILGTLTNALGRVIGISPEECGQYMWHGLYGSKAGMSRRNKYGEDVGEKNLWSPPEGKEKLWAHTLDETSK